MLNSMSGNGFFFKKKPVAIPKTFIVGGHVIEYALDCLAHANVYNEECVASSYRYHHCRRSEFKCVCS